MVVFVFFLDIKNIPCRIDSILFRLRGESVKNLFPFKIGSVPVSLHWTFFLVVGFCTVSRITTFGIEAGARTLGFFLCLAASLIFHEFGHVVAARLLRIHAEKVTLSAVGSRTVFEVRHQPVFAKYPQVELWIYTVGPFASLGLGLVFTIAVVIVENPIVQDIAEINLLIGLFHFIPVAPMDGARILRAFIEHEIGDHEAALRIARKAAAVAVTVFLLVTLFNREYAWAVGGAIIWIAGRKQQ